MSSSSSSGKSAGGDERDPVNQIVKQIPVLIDSNFAQWKKAIQIAKYVRRWGDEVFVASPDQAKEDPTTALFQHRLVLWQVLIITTRANFSYLTNLLPMGDSGRAWLQITSHFERRNAQFARGLTAKFFSLSMTSTGLALKQFANRVQDDYNQLTDMGAVVDPSHIEGVFISGLIDDFKPKMLQLEKQTLQFHDLVNELWDYAQKENIGQATMKHSAAAFMSFVPPRDVRGKGGKGGRQVRPHQRPPSGVDPGAKERDFCNHFASTGVCHLKEGFCKYVHKVMPLNVCYHWKKTGRCRRRERCPYADTHTMGEVHFVDNRRGRYDRHDPRDQYAEEGVETLVEEEYKGGDDEVNVFSVHCSAETTANVIAKAMEEEDSDDEGDEEVPDEESNHEKGNSIPLAAITAPPVIGDRPALRRRIGGFAVVPSPITPAGDYYRRFPINELTSPSVSTATSQGVAALPRTSNNDSLNPLKKSVISRPISSQKEKLSVVFGVSTAKRLARAGKNTSEWLLDSGANRHVVNDASYFVNDSIKSVDFHCTVGNGSTTIKTMGDVLLRDEVTNQVVLLTQAILMENNSKNIISLVICNDAGCTTTTANGVCTVSLKGRVILQGVLNTHARLFLMDARILFNNVPRPSPPLHPNMRLCVHPQCHLKHRHTDDDPSPRVVPAVTLMRTDGVLKVIPLPTRLLPADSKPVVLNLLLEGDSNSSLAQRLLNAHYLFGHIGFRSLRRFLGYPASDDNPTCFACVIANARPSSSPAVSLKPKAQRELQRLHFDLGFGKNSEHIFCLFVDDFSRKMWAEEVKTKDLAFPAFKSLKAKLENEKYPLRLAFFRTDADRLIGLQWTSFLNQEGVVLEASAPYRHEGNGVAESSMGIVGRGARAMLVFGAAPDRDFFFAVKHMVAICNDICLRRPSSLAGALDGQSPNSLWYGSKLPPSSRLLRGGPLFCLCFAVFYKPQRTKGSDRARPTVYMGLDNHASYVVRDLATGRIFHSADLVFKPNIFPYRPSFSPSDGLADQTLGILDHAPPLASEFLALPSVDPTPVIPFHESVPQSGGGGFVPTDLPIPSLASEKRNSLRKNPEQSLNAVEAIANSLSKSNNVNISLTSDVPLGDPISRSDAMSRPNADDWIEAETEELASHDRLQTYIWVKVADLTPGTKIYNCRPVYKEKINPETLKVERYKARFTIAAFAHTMKQGIDYDEKYASTANWSTIVLILQLAVSRGWKIWLIDVKTFFLYGRLPLTTRVYMKPFPNHPSRPGWILQLLASIYGLPVAARQAQKEFVTGLTKDDLFTQATCDDCLFIMSPNPSGAMFVLSTHVDDSTCTGNQLGYELTVARLKSIFEITIVPEPKLILGVQLERDFEAKTLKLHQENYINKALSEFNLDGSNCKDLPMDPGVANAILKKIVELAARRNSPAQVGGYESVSRSMIGKLLFLKCRPDVAFATTFMARFASCAGPDEFRLIKNIFLFLKTEPSRGIILSGKGDDSITAYSDADLGGDPNSVKSTSGVILHMNNGGALFFSSKLQRKVSDSTFMAETYAAHRACREILFFVDLCTALKFKVKLPIPLCVDNNNVFLLNSGSINHAGSKHFRIAQSFIVDCIHRGIVKLVKIDSRRNRSDLLTKALGNSLFGVHSAACFGDELSGGVLE